MRMQLMMHTIFELVYVHIPDVLVQQAYWSYRWERHYMKEKYFDEGRDDGVEIARSKNL